MHKLLILVSLLIIFSNFVLAQSEVQKTSHQLAIGLRYLNGQDQFNDEIKKSGISPLKNNPYFFKYSFQKLYINHLVLGFSASSDKVLNTIFNQSDSVLSKQNFFNFSLLGGYVILDEQNFEIFPYAAIGINFDFFLFKEKNLSVVKWDQNAINSLPLINEFNRTSLGIDFGIKCNYKISTNNEKRSIPLGIEVNYSLFPIKLKNDGIGGIVDSNVQLEGFPKSYSSSIAILISLGIEFNR